MDPEQTQQVIDDFDFAALLKNPKKASPKASPKAKSPPNPKKPAVAKVTLSHEEKVKKAKEKALLPFNPDKCHARTWGGKWGYGCQCNADPVDDTDFCKKTDHDADWRFGLFNAERPEDQGLNDPNSDEIPKEKAPNKKKEKDPEKADAPKSPKKKDEAPKSPKKKKSPKKVLTPEVMAAKAQYKSLYGIPPRGPKASDLAWLEEKNAEKEGEKANVDPDPDPEIDINEEMIADKLKEVEEELEPDMPPCLHEWECQGVHYQLNRETKEVFDENNDFMGLRDESGKMILFSTDAARDRHEEARDPEDDEPDESGTEDEDGEPDESGTEDEDGEK